MSEHKHRWVPPKPGEPFVVIDTFPQQYPWYCECGAVTHDPKSSVPCPICSRVSRDAADRMEGAIG